MQLTTILKELKATTAQLKLKVAKEVVSFSSKFLSDVTISGNKNLQRQSVVTVLFDKPQFIEIFNSKLFQKTSLEALMKINKESQ